MRLCVVFSLTLLLSITLVHAQDVQGDVYVEASVGNANPYVGEQIIYNFKLYDAVGLINPLYQPSDFEGFWRIDIGIVSQTSEQINGRNYNVTTISTALYPTHPGTITIQPSSVVLPETVFRSKETLSANQILLDVKALPEGNPADFNGAVGQITMSATLDKQAVNVGEPVAVTLTVTGTGNIEQVPPPSVPDDWRVTITAGDFKSEIQNGLIVGTRDYQIVFIPVTTGAQELPSISLDYFDPVGASYKSLSTSPIPIQVSGDTLLSPNETSVNSEPSLRLKPIENLSSIANGNGSLIVLIAIISPLGVILVIIYQQRHKIWMVKGQAKMRQEMALQAAINSLNALSLDDAKASYQLIDNTFLGYVADKLNADFDIVKQANLLQFLLQNGLSEIVISKVRIFTSEIDEGLFSPRLESITPQRRDEILSLLRDIDTEWVTR